MYKWSQKCLKSFSFENNICDLDLNSFTNMFAYAFKSRFSWIENRNKIFIRENVTKLGIYFTFVLFMRIIATNTLKEFWEKYPTSEASLKAWLHEIEISDFMSPQSLKVKYRAASILSGKRVVFNLNGNKYRLIVDIEFRLQIVFILWFGTHKEYDLIDAKTIKYVKANKK